MAAVEYEITIDRGASFILDITELKNADGTPLDTAGYKGRIRIKSEKSGYIGVWSQDDAGSLISVGASSLHIELSPSATAQIPLDYDDNGRKDLARHIYEIELYNATRVIRLLRGKCFVVGGIGI